jgi:phosphomevalonate kinase
MRVRVRAPGKALVCGEYAVLRGAPAVVAAIDRYARATFDSATGVDPVVDTQELWREGRKMGLGSSAASVVAAEAARRLAGGANLTDVRVRDDLFRYCLLAHGAAQGGKGSGSDVAAAVFGGVLEVTRIDPRSAPVIAPSQLPDLAFRLYWTGKPAHTPSMIERVQGARVADDLWDRLVQCAWAFADACQQGQSDGALGAVREYARLLAALGTAAGVPIVTSEMAPFMAQVDQLGAVAKPSGAGGGDLCLALFRTGAPTAPIDAAAHSAGLMPLDDIGVDLAGATTDLDYKGTGTAA